MRIHQLTLELPAAGIPAAEALLRLAGAEAVTLDDAADSPVLEPAPGETPLWSRVIVTATFGSGADIERVAHLLTATLQIESPIEISSLDSDAWQSQARRPIAARRFGKRLWLLPADARDATASPIPETDTPVHLHMGLAFGTGDHPTTGLCLEWLDAHPPVELDILDYGCGSGVLALAALALGGRRAWAIDNEPQAITATRRNAELNRKLDRLWAGAPQALPRIEVDLVLANILAGPLMERAQLFASFLRPGGHVVLSGVLESQAAEVSAAYAPYFEEFQCETCEGWVRLSGRRHL